MDMIKPKRDFDTVILGASCWSAGLLLQDRIDLLVIERRAGIGAEYFDSYRASSIPAPPFQSEAASKLYCELAERGATEDFFALAPLLYRQLTPFCSRLRLWTEVISIIRKGALWELEIFNASGEERIRCRRLIDGTPECRSNPTFGRENLAGCRLNCALLVPAGSRLTSWRQNDFTFRPGRRHDERFAAFAVDPASTHAEARKQLLAAWHRRPAELENCRILALGKALDYAVKRPDASFGNHYFYFNSNRFGNALLAVDSGELPNDCC